MAREAEVIDDDGNIIPPPSSDHPVMAIIFLIEYGRKRGFKIGPNVQVGDTIVQVEDIRLQKEGARTISDLEPDSDMGLILGNRG